MSLQAEPVHVFQVEECVSPAALSPGDVCQLADGRAAVLTGNTDVASGAMGSFATRGEFLITTASGTTFTVGAAPQWDNATDLVVAAGGDGDFVLGLAKTAKTSGQLVTRIMLNESVVAMPA